MAHEAPTIQGACYPLPPPSTFGALSASRQVLSYLIERGIDRQDEDIRPLIAQAYEAASKALEKAQEART